MTAHVPRSSGLTEQERRAATPMPELGQGDQVDLCIRSAIGDDKRTLPLPPGAAVWVQAVVGHLMNGGRVAVLAEDREISPNETAILGMSRPLVIHRMEVGGLPLRYVGKHRRARLQDVLALKEKVDAQGAALARDTEDLIQRHGP